MVRGMFQPMEQIAYQSWYAHCRWGEVNTSVAFKYTDTAGAEMSGIIHQGFHHHPMCFQEILYFKRIQVRIQFISPYGILDFLYFPCRSYHMFPLQNVMYLIFRQSVALYGE